MTTAISASNVEGGEYYDWYYDNQAAARHPEPHTDHLTGLSGENLGCSATRHPKWWQNLHSRRAGGGEAGNPDGCDCGEQGGFRFHRNGLSWPSKRAPTCQMSLSDPKSSESNAYYSSRGRD